MKNKPLVSVIITTKNSAKTLRGLLLSIKSQSYDNTEVILVDNKSTDGTVKIAKQFTKKVFIKGPERSAQRNYGVSKSKGQYLVILDSDMELTKNVVKESVDLLIHNKEIKASIIPEKSFGQGFWSEVKKWEREINEGESYFEAARFFDKKVFNEFKGYDIKLTGPEDWDLPRRISKKYKIGRTKSYVLHNEGKHSLLELMRRKFYYGKSADKFLKKQKISAFSPTTIYFLRPAFYKNWRKLLSRPVLTLGMIVMLTFETLGGGAGYILGKLKHD